MRDASNVREGDLLRWETYQLSTDPGDYNRQRVGDYDNERQSVYGKVVPPLKEPWARTEILIEIVKGPDHLPDLKGSRVEAPVYELHTVAPLERLALDL